MRWNGDAEEVEDGRSDIGNVGIFDVDRTIAKEHPRNLGRVHVMVAAPGTKVVRNDNISETAGNSLPGHAIARGESDDQVRRVRDVGTLIGLVPIIDFTNGCARSDRIAQLFKFFNDFSFHTGAVFLGQDPLGFAPGEVEVDAPETDRVGLGFRPVNPLEQIQGLGLRIFGQVAVLQQPSV